MAQVTATITRDNTVIASSIDYALTGTATLDVDYEVTSITGTGVTTSGNTINFAIGASAAIITFDTLPDATVEGDETIIITLTNATATGTATVVGSPQTITITNDDVDITYTLTVSSSTVVEGN